MIIHRFRLIKIKYSHQRLVTGDLLVSYSSADPNDNPDEEYTHISRFFRAD
jgi:hypothetical protein